MSLSKKHNLPNYIKGLSFSDASKKINNKFEGRNDSISLKTKEDLLNRLKMAQEEMRMINGEIPQQAENTMGEGGFAKEWEGMDSSKKAGAIAGGASALLGAGMNAFGNIETGIDTASESYQDDIDVDVAGGAVSGLASGASAGAAFGPWGAAVGGVVGGLSGLIGGNRKQKKLDEEISLANMNKTTRDWGKGNNLYRLGGTPEYDEGDKGEPVWDIEKGLWPRAQSSRQSAGLPPNPFSSGYNPKAISFGDKYSTEEFNERLTPPTFLESTAKNISLDADNTGGVKYDVGLTPPTSLNPSEPKLGALNLGYGKTSASESEQKEKFNPLELLRYAPTISNLMQLSKLKKPKTERFDKLGARYKPSYMDNEYAQNIIKSSFNSADENIANASRGSLGAYRSNVLGAGVNKTKALSDAYMNAKAFNSQQDTVKQQFNLDVDKTNLGQSNLEREARAMDKAAYETEKSKLQAAIGTDLGQIGLEEKRKGYPGKMGLLYDSNGKYIGRIDKVTGKFISADKEDEVEAKTKV